MMIIIYHPIFEKSTILFKKARYFTKKLQIKRKSKLLYDEVVKEFDDFYVAYNKIKED